MSASKLVRRMTSPTEGSFVERRIAILTGDRGAGKTVTCQGLLDRGRELGLDVAGIFCPSRFEGGVKVGIDLVDARTGVRCQLAEIDDLPGELRLGPHRFDPETLDWGAARIAAGCPCDVLIVDEIGPLEMRGEGWAVAIEVLRRDPYRLAVAVVRPSLVDAFRAAVGTASAAAARCVEPGPRAVAELLAMFESGSAPRPE